MPLLDSGSTLLTGPATEDVIVDEAAAGSSLILAVRFDFTALTSGDTVIIRFKPDLDQGGVVTTKFWELVYGTTVLPDGGVFGTDTEGFDTPVLWTEVNALVTVEQTVGTPITITWEAHRLVEPTA
jgi:hypothetical protein